MFVFFFDEFKAGQRCEIIKDRSNQFPGFRSEIGTKIIITAVNDSGSMWAYEDKPVKYRTNRNGERVTEFDPRCVLSIYYRDQLKIIGEER